MTGRRGLLAALALTAAVLLAALGVWQIERRAWKLALIARVEARLAAAPAAPPRRALRDDAYTRIRTSGTWRPVPPVFVQAVTALGGGFWVLAPLDTPAGTILVNRGFVPADARGTIGRAQGRATVTGLLRLTEPGGAFLRTNDPVADRWYSRDVPAIARARGLGRVASYFIDADAEARPSWPRGGLTVVRFPNNHLIYALTWFALAALTGTFAWRIARASRENILEQAGEHQRP